MTETIKPLEKALVEALRRLTQLFDPQFENEKEAYIQAKKALAKAEGREIE